MFAVHFDIGDIVLEDSWDVDLEAAVSVNALVGKNVVALAEMVALIGRDDAVGD